MNHNECLFLSVIIPVYNVHDYLLQTLDSVSVAASKLPKECGVELICVDDGSTDGSAELHLVIATGEVNEVEWSGAEEFPLDKMPCLGIFDSTAVVQFFEGKLGRILIVSDGYVGAKGADILSDWALTREPDSVRMILTNPAKKLKSNSIKTFSSQEMFLALDQWLEVETRSSIDSEEDEW